MFYSSLPLKKISIDTFLNDYEKQLFQLAGFGLVVNSGLVLPSRVTPAQPPRIYFNDLNTQPLDLLPYSIFKLPFERFYIDSLAPIVGSGNPLTYQNEFHDKLDLSIIADPDVFLRNFRNRKVSRYGVYQKTTDANGTDDWRYPVPYGTKNITFVFSQKSGSDSISFTLERYFYATNEKEIIVSGSGSQISNFTFEGEDVLILTLDFNTNTNSIFNFEFDFIG